MSPWARPGSQICLMGSTVWEGMAVASVGAMALPAKAGAVCASALLSGVESMPARL